MYSAALSGLCSTVSTAAVLSAVLHLLLSLRLRSVELRALVGGKNVPDLRLLLLAKRLHPLPQLGRDVRPESPQSSRVAALTEHSHAIAIEPLCARRASLSLELRAQSFELCTILLVDCLDLRLLSGGKIQILYQSALEPPAVPHAWPSLRTTTLRPNSLGTGNAGKSNKQRGSKSRSTYVQHPTSIFVQIMSAHVARNHNGRRLV
jgi:hypothetical protein